MSETTYIDYEITPADTLTGVALRHRVPVSDIRKANSSLFGDSRRPLHTLTLNKTIRIPLTSDLSQLPPDPSVLEALEQRRKLGEMTTLGMPLDEARSYLMMAEWDLEQAIKDWREDTAWEIAKAGGPAAPAQVISQCGQVTATVSFMAPPAKPEPVAAAPTLLRPRLGQGQRIAPMSKSGIEMSQLTAWKAPAEEAKPAAAAASADAAPCSDAKSVGSASTSSSRCSATVHMEAIRVVSPVGI